ncbi:hypothetical protein CHRYSEOSP005_01560 [Chryseobacterium sp. Alg-005]|uniref:energy transducer TonB n=1 Tax=Chryseobacterium sp. Alg-005 TaxID=3159516 RepID=UPI0035557402
MKKIFLFAFFIISALAFSQENGHVKPDESNIKRPLSESESPAEFPGGLNAFRMNISKNLNSSSFDSVSGTIKSDIKFKINTDGKIQDITATGSNVAFNNEMIKAIKSIKTKWKPAISNGQPVSQWVSFPMIMQMP